MAGRNPIAIPQDAPPRISKITIPVAGLLIDVYGLEELPAAASSISALWLHHPRVCRKEDMQHMASLAISNWNNRRSSTRGLIGVAFDQRHHGTRSLTVGVDDPSVKAWREGNPTHAQDMFGMVTGMVVDTSLLMDALEGYIFGNGGGAGAANGVQRRIDHHLALGVSLGGHSVWQMMFAEPRCVAGVAVIGCPDYTSLMVDRARLSKLSTYTVDKGASFVGGKDWPEALVRTINKYDPKGLLFGSSSIPTSPSAAEKERLKKELDSRVSGKKFQILSGGSDKLVGYAHSKTFVDFFQTAAETWARGSGLSVENIVYPEVGHNFTDEMIRAALRFIIDVVAEADQGSSPTASKI